LAAWTSWSTTRASSAPAAHCPDITASEVLTTLDTNLLGVVHEHRPVVASIGVAQRPVDLAGNRERAS